MVKIYVIGMITNLAISYLFKIRDEFQVIKFKKIYFKSLNKIFSAILNKHIFVSFSKKIIDDIYEEKKIIFKVIN